MCHIVCLECVTSYVLHVSHRVSGMCRIVCIESGAQVRQWYTNRSLTKQVTVSWPMTFASWPSAR